MNELSGCKKKVTQVIHDGLPTCARKMSPTTIAFPEEEKTRCYKVLKVWHRDFELNPPKLAYFL